MIELRGIRLAPTGATNDDLVGVVDGASAMNGQFLESVFKDLRIQVEFYAQLFFRPRSLPEKATDPVQDIYRRVIAIEEEIVRAPVGKGMHQESATFVAVAAGASDF